MAKTRPLTMALAASMAAAVVLALVSALATDDPPPAPPAASTAQAPPKPTVRIVSGRAEKDIDRSSFQGPWPLVSDRATITCRDRKVATVITSTGEYALTGPAADAGYPDLSAEWLDRESVPGTKTNLAPLIQAAVSLCERI